MEFRQQQAIYLQIADYVCEQILQKNWQGNNRIPSVRDLAISVEVNPNTVIRAYNYLEQKNIVYKERGLGFFIAQDGFKQAQNLKKDRFLKETLPMVFKNLDLLKIDFADLKILYQRFGGRKHEKK